jgi:hypothetical protein
VNPPTIEDVIAFVRQFQRVPDRVPIFASTRLDADLGITGLDGEDLLEEAATHFRVQLASPVDGYRTTFSLGPNEYLFGSEGVSFGLFGFLSRMIQDLREIPDPIVRDLTVAQLHDAIATRWSDRAA